MWEPVGWGQSSFGHVSTIINGTSYSFGPNGMDVRPADDFIARNTAFRNGIGPVLDVNPEQEQTFENCLKQPQGSYNLFTNNCTGPIQRCLGQIGFPVRNRMFPVSLGNDLLDSGRVRGISEYSAQNQTRSSWENAPWAK